ncbi:MAG TPA: lysylphosphatidylglycerol synthase transmembrane domain-containing protein [Candidatus Bathyarchaeia archaeon]|nr:lysylphosphatidylglycerol synthase transmembrane domain-containing protein [Candidatus Bathyarchaeia archaeon]
MNKKRILVFGVVLVLLCLLIYLQVRTWKNFDWAVFWSRTEHVNWLYVFFGVAFTYLAYVLRAVRWRIFLKPVRQTTTTRLLAPQFVGFACLAMLGRAGEMIRPYIIARKERLTFTSQMAVWGVERIFDMGAFAIMLVVSFLSPELRGLAFYRQLREAAFALMGLIVALVVFCVIVRRSGARVAQFLHDRFARIAPRFAHHVRDKVLSFSEGLETIEGLASALQLTAVSLLMWVLIMFAYYAVTHAYPELGGMTLAREVVLMGSSMVGSMLQLPAVGGGSQLATIGMLSAGFHIEHELAVSCGMMLWAITFMSVIPTGLAIARHEHVSIRAVAEAEEKAVALAD